MDHQGRLARAKRLLPERRLDALLVTHLPNIRYLCGFSGSAGVLVIATRESVFFTDGRYKDQARKEVAGARIYIQPGKSAQASAAEWLGRQKSPHRVGIEATHMTVAEKKAYSAAMPKGTRLVEAPDLIEKLRMVKDEEEVGHIRDACRVGVDLFAKLLKVLRPGVRETEAAGELEFEARKAGVEQMSFSTIIASGERSALPHGRASSAAIPSAGFVVCDFGVILAGYCSDMTRTPHVGRPAAEARSVYEAVQDSQQAALDAVKPGVSVGEVDRAARKLLQNSKLGKFFIHSTGHGVGLEIHEAPRIAAGQDDRLQPGMVVTIEPGVYLPGKWGVRIEDTVVVTETGHEILTPCSKNLLTL